MRKLTLALAVLLFPVPGGAITDLSAFLREAEQAARPTVTVRADGDLSSMAPDRNVRDQILLIQREGNDLYLEMRQSGLKALISQAGKEAAIVPKKGSRPSAFALTDALAASDFTREDLEPFRVDRYQAPRIVDETSQQVVVSLFPKQSQYSLVVISFDREKKVPLKTLYYQETLNNLVKMRRDGDQVLVGDRWLPTTITMQNIPLRTESRLQLRWTPSPPVFPELFQAAFLTRPSGLTWPETGAQPGGGD